MPIRKHPFAADEYYHCYNRGVEKRDVFLDSEDFGYFQKTLLRYTDGVTLGKLRLYKLENPSGSLVTILSYCLLPNHFHLTLKSNCDNGIAKFMQRVGTGYTMYFNKKYNRSGSLFQGKFKSEHIQTDQDLRQVHAYVTNNYKVHSISDPKKYRRFSNKELPEVRGLASNLQQEIVDIIKEKRLALEE